MTELQFLRRTAAEGEHNRILWGLVRFHTGSDSLRTLRGADRVKFPNRR